MALHQRYFGYLNDVGVDMRNLGAHQRALDLGNGHAVVEYKSSWGRPIAQWAPPFGEHRKAHFEQLRRLFDERLGKERAWYICETSATW
jgi:p-cumate 2,3-dioxygenase alpha subunit